MIIRKTRKKKHDFSIKTSTQFSSVVRSIDDSFQHNFKRVLYPDDCFKAGDDSVSFLGSLLKYVLNLPDILQNAPILSEE